VEDQRGRLQVAWWRLRTAGLAAVLGFAAAGAALWIPWERSDAREDKLCAPLRLPSGQVKSGDLVFRRGVDFISAAVLGLDSLGQYSHVGLVVGDGALKVIHAVPDENGNGSGWVKAEPLEVFLGCDHARAAAVYRLDGQRVAAADAIAAQAAAEATRIARSHLPFDTGFDLNSQDAFYCTELVWHAYRKANVDLVGKFDWLRFPLRSGAFILPSTIQKSTYLKEVFAVETRK
jgi:Permuted papain-like amidase enzyme, YaeF/YiiX, C92 family